MIRVIIIERQHLIRDVIASAVALADDHEVVATADTATSLTDLLREHPADVIVVGAASEEAFSVVRAASSQARVVVVATARTVSLARLVEAGVAGVVTAQQSLAQLIDTIRRAHAGERVIPSIDSSPASILSPRELQTLRYLAAGYTNREIAVRLGISPKTIDTHRSHLLKKLRIRNNADLTRFTIEHGLHDAALADEAPKRAELRGYPPGYAPRLAG